MIVSVLHFVYNDLYANGYIPALYNLLGFSVSVITVSDCYSISATTSIFLSSVNFAVRIYVHVSMTE